MNITHDIRSISEASPEELFGKVVIVRAGMNVPMKNGVILDTYRLDTILPTLRLLENAGAKTILIGHLGREKNETFLEVSSYFDKTLKKLIFFKDFFKEYGTGKFLVNECSLNDTIESCDPGTVLFLDNIRQTNAEKENDADLAEYLRSISDIYVNEAFPVAHREHVSTFGLPMLFALDKKYCGLRFHVELETLNRVQKPEKPSLFILGGAKIATKLPMIDKFESIYDHILIGGALYNTVLSALGKEIGVSKADTLEEEEKKRLLLALKSDKMLLPKYVICETSDGKSEKHISFIETTDNILDISPRYIESIKNIVLDCKTVLWNGPLGYYEGGYKEGTDTLMNLVENDNNYTVIGGGDTASAAKISGKEDFIDFISTGGGSTIDYLSNGSLPGTKALQHKVV